MVMPTEKPINIIRLDAVQCRKLHWLWEPYIPAGALTMLHGKGGLGKSHITAALSTAISLGACLPGQKIPNTAYPVLILSAEDDLEVILGPRLIEMGADKKKIFFPGDVFTMDKIGVAKLDRLMAVSGAKIVFIDPIVQYMGGKVDMNRANEVRSVLSSLSLLAQKYEAAIVYVHHDRKSAPGQSGADDDSAAGSADFRNAARSALKVTKYPDGRSVMHHEKSNWGSYGPSLVYSIGEDGFEWGEAVPTEVGIGVVGKSRPREAAVAFLKAELARGPVLATEMDLRAKDEGFNKRTLARAKIGVVDSYYSRNADGKLVWYWRLLEHKLAAKQKAAELAASKKSAKGFRDEDDGDKIDQQAGDGGGSIPGSDGVQVDPGSGGSVGEHDGKVELGRRRSKAAEAARRINHGSKVPTVGDWLKAEVEEPDRGADVGVQSDDEPGGRVGETTGDVGTGGYVGTGIASDFQREIDDILRSQGIEP